jgi:hypothetical protein
MNINAAIVDQRLDQIVENIRVEAAERLKIQDETKLKSLAFVFLCVKILLDLEVEETLDTLTEGGNDFGVDALHIADEQDGEFTVTLFQSKYKHKDLSGTANFPESGVEAMINAIRYLFDPDAKVSVNLLLLAKVEEVRSRIRDGLIPRVRAVLCNNGMDRNKLGQDHIDRSGFGSQVTWEHLNHERLVNILQSTKPVNDTLRLSGKAVVEDFNFSRVLVGKVSVQEVAALMERHGDRLLERNIRRYLGLQGNRVNEGICNTLREPNERPNFYFYNNGITLTCSKFEYNALQAGDYQLRVENLQIINGGQSCMTILRALHNDMICGLSQENLDKAFVLVRLYQLPAEQEDFVKNITYATNSQNPVDLRDLRANDAIQKRLETDVYQLGYFYRRKRSDAPVKSEEITSATAAEAILSVWRHRPHQAKFFSREHFGKLYELVFSPGLNGAQLVIATLIYRIAENKRKRPPSNAPEFLPYASCFLAMRMGKYLLDDLGVNTAGLTHKNFNKAKELINEQGEKYFQRALDDVTSALIRLYGGQAISLQRLSATFRRGDLIEELDRGDWDKELGKDLA